MIKIDMKNLIMETEEYVKDSLDVSRDMSDEEIEDIITKAVFEKSQKYYMSISQKQLIIKTIFNSLRRLDILQPLLDDDEITEIMVNGPNNIFIEKKGRITKLDAKFENVAKLENIIQNIVSKVNRTINESNPIVDARLIDGSRVHAVVPPIALDGPTLTIRKFPDKPLTIEDLISYGSITNEVADFLEKLVKAKYNIFISGGTGSGKTTFLNTLSNFIYKDERIITIEDSAELKIVNVPNLIRLETRDANTQGKGLIKVSHLIKASLRMRPDRIIVGEVRGEEAIDMLQAMNTGHAGSLSTGHANSSKDMLNRIETMILSSSEIPLGAVRSQIASALDIIIHLGRLRDKSRKVLEINEILGVKDGEINTNTLYKFIKTGEEDKKILGQLSRTENVFINTEKLELAGINLLEDGII
ncbi:CpaF family protein [Clostridiaceae bacterium M8S5]|nr:CpaF family protein [Clostridiaceae bacterium M8S5]